MEIPATHLERQGAAGYPGAWQSGVSQASAAPAGAAHCGAVHRAAGHGGAGHGGVWHPGAGAPRLGAEALRAAVERVAQPVFVVGTEQGEGVCQSGTAVFGEGAGPAPGTYPLSGHAPALPIERLGDASFRATHGVRCAYIAGAMANGIASVELVAALARAGMLAFFGAAGLEVAQVAQALERLEREVGASPFGSNLIHSPDDPALEEALVDLYLRHGVQRVSASAYLGLTAALVRYRVSGIERRPDGSIHTPNHVFAKVSRVEVARKFLSPPPTELLAELVRRGAITEVQAQLAEHVPLAEDLTAEADSGGHTDNRPLVALLPTMLALRDAQQAQHGFAMPLRVGAAGGIATPAAVAAAFSLGAAYVLTGSINQACVEAGTCDAVRRMLADAEQADVVMAPAADMFEMGVQVQVLKRGTLFAMRAKKLYTLYRAFESLADLPADERTLLERDYFRCSLEDAWAQTAAFFRERDPGQIERAERDPKHKLALVFRKYLGQSSTWANAGEASRKVDYQVWCGPAMGAFNEWTRGTFLAEPAQRDAVTVAENLMVGGAVLLRANMLRMQGAAIPAGFGFAPRARAELAKLRGAAAEAVA